MSPVNATVAPLLANIPSPDQGVWFIGPVPIRAYALFIILGIVVAIWWGERRFVARGGEPGVITDIAVFAVPFGLIGGRLYHVATDWHNYFGPGKNPVDALKIWQGGLGIWGAIALGAVGAWLACRRKGVPLTVVADSLAPGIVTAQAIGRLGNYFNQELFGRATTLPWGLEIYERRNAMGLSDQLNGTAINHIPVAVVHPTFLYELLWNLGVAALIVWADRRFRMGHGRVFALYVAGYTVGRFWIELMRGDPASTFLGVRVNVFTSAIVLLGAIAYLLIVRGGREDLTPRSSAPTDDPDSATQAPALGPAGHDDAARDDTAPEDEPTSADDDTRRESKTDAERQLADELESLTTGEVRTGDLPVLADEPVNTAPPTGTDAEPDGRPATAAESGPTDVAPDPVDAESDPVDADRSETVVIDVEPADADTVHAERAESGSDADEAETVNAPTGDHAGQSPVSPDAGPATSPEPVKAAVGGERSVAQDASAR